MALPTPPIHIRCAPGHCVDIRGREVGCRRVQRDGAPGKRDVVQHDDVVTEEDLRNVGFRRELMRHERAHRTVARVFDVLEHVDEIATADTLPPPAANEEGDA